MDSGVLVMKTITSINKPESQRSLVRKPVPRPAPASFQRLLAAAAPARRPSETAAATGESPPVKRSEGHHEIIFLGRLSKKNPTVSHLLVRNPQYRQRCWQIIYSKVNRNKPFKQMASGSAVYLDPATEAILWERPGAKAGPGQEVNHLTQPVAGAAHREANPAPPTDQASKAGADAAQPPAAMAHQLVSALRAYIGTPYEKMDCYELLTAGLEQIGLRYWGRDGIRAQLIRWARQANLPANTYLNGEGLIDAAGTVLYHRTVHPRRSLERETQQIWDDIKPLLESGQIISFSTRDMGHTGIIARRGPTWTFINSGHMDHDLSLPLVGERVGEENLEAEIRNWIEKSRRSGNALKIKIGRLNRSKVIRFARHRSFHQRA